MRVLQFEKDFGDIAIKGRQAMGNLLTKAEVHRILLKQKGVSTLGGRKVWFDPDVLRLNYDGEGTYLGEFQGEDEILVVTRNGEYYTCNFDLSNHFPTNYLKIEKYDKNKVWTAALFNADQEYAYLKRFNFEPSEKPLNFIGDNPQSKLYLLTDTVYPYLQVVFGGNDAFRDPLEIDADEFIGVKSYKAKGKRLSNYEVETVNELEPKRFPEPVNEEQHSTNVEIDEEDVLDEITGQMRLFDK